MTSLLSMLDRFEQAAVTYETSTDKADRDELHAARRAIMEREAELVAEIAALSERNFALVNCLDDLKMEAAATRSEREAELVKALTRIAAPHGCGCHPCVGQCRSQEALEIEVDALRDIARAAIHPSLEQE